MIHELKTWPEYFKLVKKGVKTFELRKLDRKFRKGDILRLQEYYPHYQKYSGREVHVVVMDIFKDMPALGLQTGYCIMSIRHASLFEIECVAYKPKEESK